MATNYQTKITIDATKAIKDLQILEKSFTGNDKSVAKLTKDLNKLLKEQKLLENQTKRTTDANLKCEK